MQKVVPILMLIFLLIGCNQTSQIQPSDLSPPNATSTPVTNQDNPNNNNNLTDKVKFYLQDDTEAFSLKFKEDGAKLEAADGKELARLTLDIHQKLKIKNAADQTLGYVVSKSGSWKLENPQQTQELYILRRQDDGDYKLESGTDQLIYRIKVRDDGLEIETPDNKSLYKVKVKEGKISLKNSAGETILATKSSFLPIAVACFSFDILSHEQQAALAYAVNLTGGK